MSILTRHELRRSASSIATELWSPDELYNTDPGVDVLQPALKPLEVDADRFYAFRLSLLLAPFEVLEDYRAPQGEGTGRRGDDGVLDVRCIEMHWDGQPDCSTMGIIAEQCKTTSWFRFSSTLCSRSFVVDRSAGHIQTLVAALRYSFPHLLFPADLEMRQPACNVLFEFIVHHWSRLSAYLPLLYFLFEIHERAFLAFYKQLGILVQTRKSNDIAACDVLKPKKSGKMFSWFSSKPKEAELGVNEKLQMINNLKAMLPPMFEKRYMLALANSEQFNRMQNFCRRYVGSLQEEASTYQTLAEAFATHPLTSSPVAGWYPTSALELLEKDSADSKQIATCVHRFALRKSSLTGELLLPELKAISQCELEIGVVSSSLVTFFEDLMMRTNMVNENTMQLSGKMPLPAGCEASVRPESLANAREINGRFTVELSSRNEEFDAEVAHAEAVIRTRMKRLCILWGNAVKAIASCASAEYYEEYLCSLAPRRTDDATGDWSASHPLKRCLGVEDGVEESVCTVYRNDGQGTVTCGP
ncbi:hypothetical protein LSCM1_03018 [Leishmania martiniquensis]|uniref:Uncharacterized protein n=1 Tax=Leishmania martiniquensis TaxID=1580590 RepID=A0A836GYG1_9TRYP|nr:hypothetical protein LSCM1_03018 [Leishmania martiniquensis]